MASSSEFDTQTPNTANALTTQQILSPMSWGKLQSTTVYLKSIELHKRVFILGRAQDCDVTITSKNFPAGAVATVSKTHFMLTHEDAKGFAFVQDFSKNGTFINRKVIGKGSRCILQHGDEIAIGTSQQRVYVFQAPTQENLYLPLELRHKYMTSKQLGSGSCGEVRLLYRKNDLTEFAVKKITKNKALSKVINNPKYIESEINILRSLCHPNIISTEEIVEKDDTVFIVLEYMKGGDLSSYMNSHIDPIPEHIAKHIFYQIILGVAYLHSRDVTHRDLKPENILLTSDDPRPRVKISDFGLSKMIHGNTVMSTLCGTPCYVAPEIVDARCATYTKAVDIWSLGVLLYKMLSQELPFQAKQENALFAHILSAEYTMNGAPWNSISEPAKDLVRRMLVRDPAKRIAIQEILGHPWLTKDYGAPETEKENVSSGEIPQPPAKRARMC